ncbi:AEC family transporter [Falsirhodobacter halotolerans]|uniref:AEC family transporter n=1 Tax=Falsirhodobacter halotolerans TaxID=1146892 RepID=UPI001FD44BE2|nr:AEC family transporter [Falsirhodobacter halotolerans]MCJ8140653.1 AEC family transporter [Falsirhodobacter halotolerans]
MIAMLTQMTPFFALIGVGYLAVRGGWLTPEAIAALTRFVFLFPLPALLFRFAADLSLAEVFTWRPVLAYLVGTGAVFALVFVVARRRGETLAPAAIEAQCAVTGNTGFLGLPLLIGVLGTAAVGPILMTLVLDIGVFATLVVVMITLSRQATLDRGLPGRILRGWLGNPMVLSLTAGLVWAALGRDLWPPVDTSLALLATAATPGALFAIGGSLAGAGGERPAIAAWLGGAKLILHPLAVAAALWGAGVSGLVAQAMIATAALPVAGNVYMLAQHYGIAPRRVSSAIFLSTLASLLTLGGVLAWGQT